MGSVADPSTRPLSEVARHLVAPSGIVDTLWFEVEERCREFGDEFDAWQDGLGQLALAVRADGTFAATVGGVTFSIPRQVAKTFIVMRIVVALCTLFPNLTVVWTAHRTRTATNTFQKMKAFVLRPAVKPYLRPGSNNGTGIRDANGEQEIPFANGSKIMFGAREQGFGRGFDEVDVEVFDEAQILTENAIDDMVPAMNQAANPLLFFLGTPPKPTDPGEVFARKRAEAIAGDSDDTLYIEFSADRGCDPMDRRQWAKANPSFPHRTPESAILRMRKNLSLDSFVREALGIWDETAGVFPPGSWERTLDRQSSLEGGRLSIAWDVAKDGSWASVVFGGRRPDNRWHVELVRDGCLAGTGWVADRVALAADRAGDRLVSIGVAAGSPAAALVPEVRRACAERNVKLADSPKGRGVQLVELATSQYAQGCGALFTAVKDRMLQRLDQRELNEAAAHAKRRNVGELWVWDRKGSKDITPLCAATVAVRAFELSPTPAPMFVYHFDDV